MRQVTEGLRPAVAAVANQAWFAEPSPAVLNDFRERVEAGAGRPAGMNTVGIMMDRLSILAMKHWALVNRNDAPEKASFLVRTQVHELVTTLAESQRGSSSINNKITSHMTVIDAGEFSSACFGLFSTNLLLWEAQELLYHRDIASLPSEELRRYIAFFSEGNLLRNEYIQACDQTWWLLVDAVP
jgi:hypothetical protein